MELLLKEILAELRRIGSILEGFENKKNPPPPMMNDASGTVPSHSSTSNEATAFAVRLERIYKRAGNGGYDWKGANSAARAFLAKHPIEDRARLVRFVDEHQSSLAGKLPVYPGMFDELWAYMIDKGG